MDLLYGTQSWHSSDICRCNRQIQRNPKKPTSGNHEMHQTVYIFSLNQIGRYEFVDIALSLQ
jgi:hypothetical protein